MTATVQRPAAALVTLSLSDAATGQVERLTCTPDHPLYVSGKGWAEAGDLGVGTSIVTRAGPPVVVKSVSWRRDETGRKPFTVYNLTVQGDHTYFAGTLDGGAWAHNVDCISGDTLKALRKEFNEEAKPAYWKNKAATQPIPYSPEALERMESGKGFIGGDGFPMELHHEIPLSRGGTNDFSNFIEMTRTDHRLGGNLKLNHPDIYP